MAEYAAQQEKQERARQAQLEKLKLWQVRRWERRAAARPAQMPAGVPVHGRCWRSLLVNGGLSCCFSPCPAALQAKQEREAAARPESKRWIDEAIINKCVQPHSLAPCDQTDQPCACVRVHCDQLLVIRP
jgi:hypothetical protein